MVMFVHILLLKWYLITESVLRRRQINQFKTYSNTVSFGRLDETNT